jgi:hypothetical protein
MSPRTVVPIKLYTIRVHCDTLSATYQYNIFIKMPLTDIVAVTTRAVCDFKLQNNINNKSQVFVCGCNRYSRKQKYYVMSKQPSWSLVSEYLATDVRYVHRVAI